MPRNPIAKCEVSWEDRYGTTHSGNLPQFIIHECIENTIDIAAVQLVFPWVSIADFSFYHIKCPYTWEPTPVSPDVYKILHEIRETNYPGTITYPYWDFKPVPDSDWTVHTATSGIMIRHSRGSKHGWLCVDPACRYYQLYGIPYFYI